MAGCPHPDGFGHELSGIEYDVIWICVDISNWLIKSKRCMFVGQRTVLKGGIG